MNAPASVSIFHQALKRAGGMEHYAICIARAFREAGSRVTVYAAQAEPGLSGELGIEFVSIRSFRGFRKLRDWAFCRQVMRVSKSAPGLQIALSRVPVRHIAVCGGTHKGFQRATGRVHGPFDWLQSLLESRAYASAKFIVSHSELCTGELREYYGVEDKKIRTIYPPVEARFSPGETAASRKQLGLPLDKTILLFPSMGHKRKGLPPICRALRSFGDEVVLAVAGNLPGNSSQFVRPLGYVKDMQVAYRAADFTILGSWYEPFGLVGPESVLCGTRLIFEERIGCLPAISGGVTFRFSVRDERSIARAVEQALLMKREGTHRISEPHASLRYDPDPGKHVSELAGLFPEIL